MKELKIERLAHDLRGIAHADGLTWFVEGALPGETVEARELMQRQQLVDAEAVTIIDAAAGRTQPACDYVGNCGGCSLQHVDHNNQIRFKQQVLLDQLVRIGKVVPAQTGEPLLSPPWAYRRRARLSCKWLSQDKHMALGLRARHSQDIVDIEHCAVLVPSLEALLLPLRESLSRWSQPRQLGHVELLAADNGVAMLLRLLVAPSAVDADLLRALSEKTALNIFLQTEEKIPPQFYCGPQPSLFIRHENSDTTLGCLPGDFVQGNAVVNAQLVEAVLEALQPVVTDSVLEAFCGLGNFTLPLAQHVAQVTALELDSGMLERARTHANAQQIANVRWQACNLDQFDAQKLRLPAFGKILLDPPRDGAQAFCRAVPVDQVERIVYVSCNASTLARDAATLAERGFALHSVRLVDMFPQTEHIETLAVFLRDASLLKQKKKEKKQQAATVQKRLKR